MPVTVAVNQMTVVPKASSAHTVAFPDVCKTPSPAGPVPIPYPSFATIATKRQMSRTKAVAPMMGAAKMPTRDSGDEAGTLREVIQLTNSMNQLNVRLQALSSGDPNQWQAILEGYAVLASALYWTRRKDD